MSECVPVIIALATIALIVSVIYLAVSCAFTLHELNGSGKRVELTERNSREDAANVCHLLNKHCIDKAERWTVKEETR